MTNLTVSIVEVGVGRPLVAVAEGRRRRWLRAVAEAAAGAWGAEAAGEAAGAAGGEGLAEPGPPVAEPHLDPGLGQLGPNSELGVE